MKKLFIIFLAAIITFSFAACSSDSGESSIPTSSGNNPTKSSQPTSSQEDKTPPTAEKSFRVNANLPEYVATIIFSDMDSSIAQTLVITEKESKKQIQEIELPENESFTKDAVYVLDITFDENLDLLVPETFTNSSIHFHGYVWDTKENQFVYAPNFANLPNFALDSENKRILSNRTASMISSYSMCYYDDNKKDFVCQNSLYFEWADGEGSQTQVVESKLQNGELKTIEEILADVDMFSHITESTPKVGKYYKEGSLWDLDSKKWESYFSIDIFKSFS